MPPVDRLNFKHTMVDVNLTAPPEPRVIRSASSRAPVQEVTPPTIVRPFEPEAPPVEVVAPVDRNVRTLMRWTDPEVLVQVPTQISVVVQEVRIPATVDPRLVLLYARSSEQARAYGLLRHRVLGVSDLKVITVTSARPGEGKTTCAVNLALALADETMARVLLIEANPERPALSAVFGFEPTDSLMIRHTQFAEAIQPYPVAAVAGTRLHVAALQRGAQRVPRLDRLLFHAALHDLRAAYDHIVIDAAAVLESADADVASECADGVILVARAQSSRKSALEQAVAQLHPARILGTVVLDA